MDGGARFVYRVSGFGSQIESKLVEFLRELVQVAFCSWCGTVTTAPLYLVSCGHVICLQCICFSRPAKCPVHGKTAVDIRNAPLLRSYDAGREKVRCVNAMRGCRYEGTLQALDGHLKDACAFHIVACARCRRGVPCKDMSTHFPTCEGASGASENSGAVAFLVEDLGNTRKELERALTLANSDEQCELRKAVISASEMLVRLEAQLTLLSSTQ